MTNRKRKMTNKKSPQEPTNSSATPADPAVPETPNVKNVDPAQADTADVLNIDVEPVAHVDLTEKSFRLLLDSWPFYEEAGDGDPALGAAVAEIEDFVQDESEPPEVRAVLVRILRELKRVGFDGCFMYLHPDHWKWEF